MWSLGAGKCCIGETAALRLADEKLWINAQCVSDSPHCCEVPNCTVRNLTAPLAADGQGQGKVPSIFSVQVCSQFMYLPVWCLRKMLDRFQVFLCLLCWVCGGGRESDATVLRTENSVPKTPCWINLALAQVILDYVTCSDGHAYLYAAAESCLHRKTT
jgi:hypothetical protein